MKYTRERMVEEIVARSKRWEDAQAHAYATSAVIAAVDAAPGPDTPTASTGRARASIQAAAGRAARYDPPPARRMKPPTEAVVGMVRRALRGRRPGQSVIVDVGVPYSIYAAMQKYKVIQAGHKAGVAAIQDENIAQVLAGKKAPE